VNEELEALAYSISHDLKAPLRAISGFTAILIEEYASALDDEGTRLLGIVRESTRKMERLINLLLELSRVGSVELKASRVDMGAMAKAMFHEVATPEEKAGISLSIDGLPEAEGDPPMLRLVWAKLLSNAVKFVGRSSKREIRIDSSICSGEILYRVRDSGAGFDMAYVGKLFNAFQRLHSTEEYEGDGVGLAIVKRIVLRHGGRVGAEGRVGEGATFWFSLPSAASSAGGEAK
jgi:light-regulated signal transduction histidine kinase (bacteriophytochrome)